MRNIDNTDNSCLPLPNILKKVILFVSILSTLLPCQFVIKKQYPLGAITPSPAITSICFTDSLNGYAVGKYGFYIKTSDGGQNWYSLPTISGSSLINYNEIIFTNSSVGYIIGYAGAVLKTTNAGRSWRWLDCGSNRRLTSVYFINSDTGFVSDDWFRIFGTTDGGTSWNLKYEEHHYEEIQCLTFFNDRIGIACGYSHAVRSVDGGNTWLPYSPSPTLIYNVKPNFTVGIVGGGINRTTNAGNSWQNISYIASRAFSEIRFADTLHGIITEYQRLFYTKDGGITWNNYNNAILGDLSALCMISKSVFYVGNWAGVLYKIIDTSSAISSSRTEDIFKREAPSTRIFPNPSSSETTIKYALPSAGFVSLTIYNSLGQKIETLIEQEQQPGEHTTIFQGKDKAAGVYFYRLVCGKESFTGKMLLVR